MTTLDRHTRLATEQQLIRDATQQLLAGTPHRSNGSLTIASLAAEAGVPRHRIYEHHADLVAEFKAKAHNGGPPPPTSKPYNNSWPTPAHTSNAGSHRGTTQSQDHNALRCHHRTHPRHHGQQRPHDAEPETPRCLNRSHHQQGRRGPALRQNRYRSHR
jgi:hypothetical protein